MFLAVWVSVAVGVGAASRALAARDSTQQRRRGAVFADVQFTSHRSSIAVACLLCAVVVALSARQNPGVTVAFDCILAGSGTWLSFVDIDTHTVPRRSQVIVWTGAAALLSVAGLAGGSVSMTGAAGGSVAMWGVMKTIEMLSRGDMGPADAVFAGYLGMFVGSRSVSLVPAALMTAFVLGGVAALLLAVVGGFGRRSHLPFAPFLFLGAIISVLR